MTGDPLLIAFVITIIVMILAIILINLSSAMNTAGASVSLITFLGTLVIGLADMVNVLLLSLIF